MIINSKNDYLSRIGRKVISEDEIYRGVRSAAERINSLYDGSPMLLVSVLKGSVIFAGDLMKYVNIPCELDFLAAKSYYDSTDSSGSVKITHMLERDIKGCRVILIEDIVDTGRTLDAVTKQLKSMDPLSITTVTLLDKPQRRQVDFKADISLFTIPDIFVVGYGLDCGGYYRNLPYIAEYKPDGK